MTSLKNVWVALIAVAIIAIGAYYYPSVKSTTNGLFGSTSCGSITCLEGGLRLVTDAGGDFESDVAAVFGGTFTLGSSGTALSQLQKGSCNLLTAGATVTATTTKQFDCAVTGVISTDTVFATGTSTIAANGGVMFISGATASTTNGFITVWVTNLTGANNTVPLGIASSTKYLILR